METAIIASSNSHCKRKKVGAVISKERRIISTGWNGTPSGQANCCEKETRKIPMVSKDTVIHAEANAILWAAREGLKLKDTTLYVTMSPCIECAKMIIQAGIKEVVYKEAYRCTRSIELLESSGIKVEKYG